VKGGKEEMFETAIQALIGLVEAGIIIIGAKVVVLLVEKLIKE